MRHRLVKLFTQRHTENRARVWICIIYGKKEEEEEGEDIKGKGVSHRCRVLQSTSGTLVFTLSKMGHHGKISINGVIWFDLRCKRICLVAGLKTDCRDFPGGAVVGNLPPMWGTRVRSLVQEDPTCRRAAKPMWHNYGRSLRSSAHEPQLPSPRARTTEVHVPGAHAPQQDKPLQWEARAPQRRVAPALRNWRKPACSNEDPMQPKINKI